MATDETTLIINDGDPFTDIQALRLLVKSIIRCDQLDDDAEGMVQALFTQKELLQSSDTVAAGLRQILMNTLQQPGGDTAAIKDLLSKVLQHELETQDNRHVYVAAGKPNPNAVWWPNPAREGETRSIYTELPYARQFPIVDASTAIGSAGSCFAMEIADRLQQQGFNYVVTEDNLHPTKGVHNACANWGVIFNVPAFRQLIEKAFGYRTLPKVLWSIEKDGKTVYRDPFREEVEFQSVEEYEQGYESHMRAAREALEQVEVFVITLGLNEVWYLKSDGSVFSRNPWRFSPSLVERKVLTVEENVAELQKMLDIWRQHNPDLKLIVSVSPVPLLATYQADEMHVAAATCQGKATLRLAAEQFVKQNEDVYYFPSFEKVMYCTEKPFEDDQRHVRRETVAGVMELFDTVFVDQAAASQAVTPEGDTAAPVPVPGEKQFNILMLIDWQEQQDLPAGALQAYLNSFGQSDDIQIVAAAYDVPEEERAGVATWLQGVIENSGYSTQTCAEIVLLDDITVESIPPLMSGMQAVMRTGQASDEAVVNLADQLSLRVIDPDERSCKLALRNWNEMLSSIAVAEELKSHGADQAAIQLLDTYESGYIEFFRSGQTPHDAYIAMRHLYCASNGLLNDNLKKAYANVYPSHQHRQVIHQGLLSAEPAGRIADAINENGYHVFDFQLDENICDRLLQFARQTPCHPRDASGVRDESVIYNPDQPVAVRYDFDEQVLLENNDIQQLVMDESLLDIAEAYMGCEPAIDLVAMWWSTALQADAEAVSRAAQMYHFDMDRANLFKFFVYLTDVTEDNGPHCFVRGSHLRKPPALIRDGRVPDQEISSFYQAEDMVELTGRKGTIIAADTRGYHKGKPLLNGDRLIFQIQFGSSLFGAPYKPVRVNEAFTPDFRRMLDARQHVFQKFVA